jgi:hypothetical protein
MDSWDLLQTDGSRGSVDRRFIQPTGHFGRLRKFPMGNPGAWEGKIENDGDKSYRSEDSLELMGSPVSSKQTLLATCRNIPSRTRMRDYGQADCETRPNCATLCCPVIHGQR